MRVLSLDFSTSTGFALAEGEMGGLRPTILKKGTIELENTILAYGKYPFCYYVAANTLATRIFALIERTRPDAIVIEESNLGKSRYAQKSLEFVHCLVLQKILSMGALIPPVVYLSSSAWRQALKLEMTKEQKKANAKLSKAKRESAALGQKLDKKKLGVRGRVTKKHVAIAWVLETYGLKLRACDDDIADAICICAAFFRNPVPCDGT